MVTKQKPVRCTECQKHGHAAGACPTGAVICPYCGYNHRYNECPVRKRPYYYQCRNCYNSGYEYWGHGAFDDRCPVFREYLAHLDKEQRDKEGLRRNITAQVATTITGAAEIKPAAQEPERQPLKKAVRKIKQNTPTKEVTDVSDVKKTNDVKQTNDVITKTEVMDLIALIEDVLAEKLGWEHKGLISGVAKAKLFGGDVGGDVEMTSKTTSPPKSGNSQPPGKSPYSHRMFSRHPR